MATKKRGVSEGAQEERQALLMPSEYLKDDSESLADEELIFDIKGKELSLGEVNYWYIGYDTLDSYAKLPNESEWVLEGKCHETEALKQVVDVKLFNELMEKAK